jgi:hypothetical protein
VDGAGGDAGPGLDAQAKAAYRARLGELEAELEEARAFNDPVRRERAEAERDALARELAAAVGLGGRDRPSGSDAERARVNVTRALRTAVGRLGEYDAALGRHLEAGLSTGTFCVYRPEPGLVAWTVRG